MRFPEIPPRTNLALAGFSAIGLLLVCQQWFLRLIADRFIYEVDPAHAPILIFVASQVIAGLIFLMLLRVIPPLRPGKVILAFMLVTGLIMRLLLFGTTPILEVDFYRYLWDGAALLQGFNPWLLSPEMVRQSADPELQALAGSAGSYFDRINYPELKTIYPGLSQLAFGFASWIDSWNLDSWRLLLLMSEVISIVLLLRLLKQFNRSPLWAALYWWNPLVIKELFNSAHMDALLVPLLLAAVLLMMSKRYRLSSIALALAAGIKLWPLLLLPFCLRPLLANPLRLMQSLLAITVILLLFIAPLLIYGLGAESGLLGFSQDWLRNTGPFQLVLGVSNVFSGFLDPAILARFLVASSLVGLVFYLNREPAGNAETLLQNLVWVIAALFLLSPAQFPWYIIWFTPLLCLYPQRGLLLLTALMPIYYLWFYFDARGEAGFFDHTIVWLQYLPVLLLFFLDYCLKPLVNPAYVQAK
jgi:alpha-1,6-mannosyltransferase